MSGATEALSGRLGIDTTDFKTGIAAANRELRVLESGFRASAASLGDWTKDATGLESRIKSLTSQIEIQKLKVAALRENYEKMAAENGENSKAAQEAEIKLNKEAEALGKMESELARTEKSLGELSQAQEQAGQSAATAEKKVHHFGQVISGVGTAIKGALTVATALVGLLATLTGALIGLGAATVGPASDLAETVSKVGVVFDDQAERVLAYGENAATALGMSKNEALSAAGVFGNLFRSMEMSSESSSDMSLSLVSLAADLSSFNNMNPTEVLDKLRAGITGESEPLKDLGINLNAATVAAKAMELGLYSTTQSTLDLQKNQIGAEKAQTAYNDAVKRYGADSLQARDAGVKLAEAQQKVEEAAQGTVDELTAAQKAQATYALIMEQTSLAQGDYARTAAGAANQGRTLKAIIEDMRAEIGTGYIPTLEAGQRALVGLLGGDFVSSLIDSFVSEISGLGGILQPLFDELTNFDGDFGALTNVAVAVVQNLLSALANGMPQMLQVGLNIIMTILQGILQSLPTLLPVVVQMLQFLIGFIVQSLPLLTDAGVQLLLTLVTGLLTALPSLVEAGLKMLITLVQGLAQAMPELIPLISTIIPQIILILLNNLPLLIDAALQLLLALAQGLVAALPILIPAIPVIVQAIFDALIVALPMIATAAGELIATLAMSMIAAIPGVIDAVMKIHASIRDFFFRSGPSMLEIGKSIVDGIWKGIQGQKDVFMNQIRGFFSGLVETVKNALGISSPSKLFADQVGAQIPPGIGQGFSRALPGLEQDLGTAVQGLASNIEVDVNPRLRSGPGRSSTTTIQIGDIIIDARGATDPQAVGQEVRDTIRDTIVGKLRSEGAF